MNLTTQPVTIYISAASDLMTEREVLARTIAELPVTLAWHIVQTPMDYQIVDASAIASADLYFLVFGSDIRAPVGLELETALRHNAPVRGYFKRGVGYTPAGQAFAHRVRQQIAWQHFDSLVQISRQVQAEVVSYLLRQQHVYALSATEIVHLEAVLNNLGSDLHPSAEHNLAAEGTGHSAVLLSRERFMPSDGILVGSPPEE